MGCLVPEHTAALDKPKTVATSALARHAYIVAYMQWFLPSGYQFRRTSPSYKDDVIRVGEETQNAMLEFVSNFGLLGRGFGTILKLMVKLKSLRVLELQSKRFAFSELLDQPSTRRLHLHIHTSKFKVSLLMRRVFHCYLHSRWRWSPRRYMPID